MPTIDDTMADIVLELDDREIYNDIRSETGLEGTETIIDSDPAYEWKGWSRTYRVLAGYTKFDYFTATMPNPLSWQIQTHSATDTDGAPYYDYDIKIVTTNQDNVRAVEITNTGSEDMWIHFYVRYKYLVSEGQSHEESTYSVISVREVDVTSVAKYGPRVMNLVWAEGATENQMRSECKAKLAWYKDPYMRAYVKFLGKNAATIADLFGTEIDEKWTLVSTWLGLNADFRLKALEMNADPADYVFANLTLVQLRPSEGLARFIWDSSKWDSTDILT